MSKATDIAVTLFEGEDGAFVDLAQGTPGAIRYGSYGAVPESVMFFSCPCGCGAIGQCYVRAFPGKPHWHNSGTREKPTLQPSIGFSGGPKDDIESDGYHWHGYLRDGVWVSC